MPRRASFHGDKTTIAKLDGMLASILVIKSRLWAMQFYYLEGITEHIVALSIIIIDVVDFAFKTFFT